MENQERALLDAVEVLSGSSQDYWLCNGTLLGIIRDKRLIPWDVDIDIGVLSDNFSKDMTISLFSKNGFVLYDNGEDSDYVAFKKYDIKVDINIYHQENGQYNTLWKIPNFSLIRRALNRLIMLANLIFSKKICLLNASHFTTEGYSIPVPFLFPLKKIEFNGVQVSVPLEPEQVLEWTYGSNWRTPKKNYNWRTEGANNVRS